MAQDPKQTEAPSRLSKLSMLIPVVMLPLGVWLGYRTFRDRSFADLQEAFFGIPATSLALAGACAAASYLCLSGFDALAIRYLGKSLPYRKIALTSFVALGIGHTVGVAVLSSGALRFRFYSNFGLRTGEIGKLIVFCGITVGLGLMTLGGSILLSQPDVGLGAIGLSPALGRALGVGCLALVALYVVLAWRRKKPFRIRGHEFRLPDVRIALAQIVIATVNFAFVAATLHFLLAGATSYFQTVAAYVLGNVSGLVSHVPGGIGVLEYVISSLVPNTDVVGALIGFRILYYLVPLALAIAALVATELSRLRGG